MMYKENMTSNMQTQHLRHSLESRMVDPSSIREIETLKNELNLTSKIKASLEQQIQVYKKQSVSNSVLSSRIPKRLIPSRRCRICCKNCIKLKKN